MKIRSASIDDLHNEVGFVLEGDGCRRAKLALWFCRFAYRVHHALLLTILRRPWRTDRFRYPAIGQEPFNLSLAEFGPGMEISVTAANHSFKVPAFQLYAKEFLQDEAVIAMDLDAVGAYIILLCHQWNEGSVPSEPTMLARICRTTVERIQKIWPQVAVKFHPQDVRKTGS